MESELLQSQSSNHKVYSVVYSKAGPAEPLSYIPPSLVFFDADDEAYASYGPQMFNLWAGSIGATVSSTKCQMATNTNISLPLTPQPESMIWHGSKQAAPLVSTTF